MARQPQQGAACESRKRTPGAAGAARGGQQNNSLATAGDGSKIERWQIGPFLLDRRRRLLLANGRPVKIGTMQFDLLVYLVERHADDPAPARDEIVAHVWQGMAVGENSLPVQLSALRKVLADNGGDEKLIQTLPGRRYRYVGEVNKAGAVRPEKPESPGNTGNIAEYADVPLAVATGHSRSWAAGRRMTVGGAVAVGALALTAVMLLRLEWIAPLPAPPQLSIMVLPFHIFGADKTQDYLADAVTDDLTTELAQIPGSFVIARETANTFKGSDVAAIHRAVHIRYLIEGGIEPREASLRINVRLVDAQTSAEVWAQSFDMSRDRLAEARDVIVNRMMAALDVQLVRAESSRSQRDRPDNPGALDLFFQARSILDQGDTLADYEAAQAKLETAITRQPDFEDALAELGWLLLCKLNDTDDPTQEVDEARATTALQDALRLSRRNTRALTAHGRLLSVQGDYAGAIAEAHAALALNPNSADAQLVLANAEFYQGHLDAAVPPLQASIRLDPEGPRSRQLYFRLGSTRLFQGNFAEAISLLRRASSGDVDPMPGTGMWGRPEKTRLYMIAAYQLSGDSQTAASLYADYKRKWLHRTVWRVGAFAPKTLSALAGFANFLRALRQAGMPPFADEAVDDHVPASTVPIAGGDFTPTPRTIPGARVIDTGAMAVLAGSGVQRLVIDLGSGSSVIAGAVWADWASRPAGDEAYVNEVARPFSERFPQAPIVVMADGTYGVTSYNGCLHLVSWIRNPVYWYRGGEEAWAKAGHPASYRRRD